jgi:hypothetical protein
MAFLGELQRNWEGQEVKFFVPDEEWRLHLEESASVTSTLPIVTVVNGTSASDRPGYFSDEAGMYVWFSGWGKSCMKGSFRIAYPAGGGGAKYRFEVRSEAVDIRVMDFTID